jgi:hypothetical protein
VRNNAAQGNWSAGGRSRPRSASCRVSRSVNPAPCRAYPSRPVIMPNKGVRKFAPVTERPDVASLLDACFQAPLPPVRIPPRLQQLNRDVAQCGLKCAPVFVVYGELRWLSGYASLAMNCIVHIERIVHRLVRCERRPIFCS